MAEGDWTKALALNTVAAYQSFIEKYPRNEHADEAKGQRATFFSASIDIAMLYKLQRCNLQRRGGLSLI